MLRGQGEIVHQGQRRHVDGAADRQLAVGVGTVIVHVRLEDVAATEEVQFAGRRADLRVRGHRIGQGATEVVDAQRLQVVADLVGQREFHQRQGLSRMPDDVGVGDAGVQVSAAVVVVGRDRALEALGAHPAVAIPGGATVLQPHAVHHAVAHAPMPFARTRIGTVAQVPAVELSGDAAHDRQIELRQLVMHRGVVAGAERSGRPSAARRVVPSEAARRPPLRPAADRPSPTILAASQGMAVPPRRRRPTRSSGLRTASSSTAC